MPKDKTSLNQSTPSRLPRLVTFLIFSGALNIAFIGTFVWQTLRSPSLVPSEKRAAKLSPSTNEELLRMTCQMGFGQLTSFLQDKGLVEQGLTKRDLALASLVAFHDFDLPRALGRQLIQKRKIAFYHPEGGERIDVEVYPGLAEFEFAAVAKFAKTEKWPLTAEGLFHELQRSLPPYEPTLIEALRFTKEIRAVERIFSLSAFPIAIEPLLEIVSLFSWEEFFAFLKQAPLSQESAREVRRDLLLAALEQRSPLAARLLIETEEEWLVKRAADPLLEQIFSLTHLRTPKFQELARAVLTSPRADPVCEKAAELLYRFAGEPSPETCDRETALAHFGIAQKEKEEVATPVLIQAPEKKKRGKVHIVEAGDSLWKISRLYGVSIERIVEENRLEDERLFPGKSLKIPDLK